MLSVCTASRISFKKLGKFLLLVRGVRDQVLFVQQVAYSSKVAEISVSGMGWLGPCRQLGMPLEYSIVIIILGVLSTRIARSYQCSCIASSMAITSEDNLNSYGGSNVSPLASLDAPPCYPLWTLQKHPPWRLTANFLHSCFGGGLQNGNSWILWSRFIENGTFSKDNKNHLLVEVSTMPSTFIRLFFSADFEAVAKKNLCFPTIISEI